MIKRTALIFLLSGAACTAQSVLTAPDLTSQAPATASRPTGNVSGNPQSFPGQPAGTPTSNETNQTWSTPNEANQAGAAQKEMFPEPSISSRISGPLTARSEFQQYAEDATGRVLPVFGRQLFDQVPTTFAPVQNVPVPADYVIGPGDQLLIRAWGKIELDSHVTVDRNGQISLPKVGALTVAGLRYSQLEDYLRSAIGNLYKGFELNVTLGQLRTIQIFVLGNARQPGTYTVSALSTLVDALFVSGGPSATGSMRKIELRRDGQTISELDVYDLVAKGDKSHDVRLLPGDVIYIAPIGPQIAISGDVNRPGVFELKADTDVASALAFAGGMTSLADAERVVLQRIDDHKSRTVVEFSLDSEGQARTLKDGDLLRVFPLSPKIDNAVTLRGNVAEPGLYRWKTGMRISDLIPSRTALITRNYWNRQNELVRPELEHPFAVPPPAGPTTTASEGELSSGNLSAQAHGRGSDLQGATSDNHAFDVNQNRQPGEFAATGTGIAANIGQNSAEINWDYALIERLDDHDLSTRLIPFNLGGAIDNPASADNHELKPGDVVTIFSRADLELPVEKQATFVRVGGEVNAPGVYRVNPGETLRDVVAKAGGLTSHSYLYASIFTRVSARRAQEAQLRQTADELQRELVTKYANATPQAGQTAADQQAQLALQQSALARLTSIQPTGRVVLKMKPGASTVEDLPAMALEDGDTFYVPPRPSTVEVAGAVYNANAFRYSPGERLESYLNDAGGATRDADEKRMFVIRADGTVVSRQAHAKYEHGRYDHLKLLPGDAIVVPEKLRVSSTMSQLIQWTQLSSSLALTAAALNVIK